VRHAATVAVGHSGNALVSINEANLRRPG